MTDRILSRCIDSSTKTKEKLGAPRIFSPLVQLQLFFHWMKYYLPENYLASQLQCSQSTIDTYLNSTQLEFVAEFQGIENPEIKFPHRKIRDQKSIIITLPDGRKFRISALVDGSEQQIQIPSTGGHLNQYKAYLFQGNFWNKFTLVANLNYTPLIFKLLLHPGMA
jgi:hypothetical protein